MNDFDAKWQGLVARARQARPNLEESPPFGFTTRLSALTQWTPEAPSSRIWERMALGSLAGVAALLAVCLAVELPHCRDSQPFNPRIGNTVAQLVWSL
jgi:hypothetical protein